jgi:hypothetical protein
MKKTSTFVTQGKFTETCIDIFLLAMCVWKVIFLMSNVSLLNWQRFLWRNPHYYRASLYCICATSQQKYAKFTHFPLQLMQSWHKMILSISEMTEKRKYDLMHHSKNVWLLGTLCISSFIKMLSMVWHWKLYAFPVS